MFILTLINGLFIAAIGILIIKFRRQIKMWIGSIGFIEHYLGRGSTYLIIILIGAAFITVGFLWPFGGKEFFESSRQLK